MVPPDKFGRLTAEEIDREVQERRDAIFQMFGWLYPSILSGEIEELLRLRPAAQARAAPAQDASRRTDDNLRGVFG